MANYTDQLTLAAFNAAAEGRGNVKLVWGSYSGNGRYGIDHPNTLTFDGKPLVVSIHRVFFNSTDTDKLELWYGRTNCNGTLSSGTYTVGVKWTENSVSWLCTSKAEGQFNEVSCEYFYFALIGL